MTGKNLPPPSGGDLTAFLRDRRANTGDDEPTPDVAPVAPVAPRAAPVRRSQGSGMDRRSWYMPKTVADALAAAVEDLHYDTRRPKHEVLSALVEVALANQDQVREKLTGEHPSH